MKHSIRWPLAVLLACFMLLSAPYPVAAFSVAENPNNSLDTFPNNPGDTLISSGGVTTLVVELGENFAIDGLGNCTGFNCNDSYDSFRMQVPAGLEITLTELQVANVDGTAEQLWVFPGPPGGAGVIRMPVHLQTDWQTGELFRLTDSLTINGANPNSTNFVLGPGFYDVIAFNFAFIGGGAFEATFTASQIVIPLPMSLALFAPALGLLASVRFRKA